MNAMRGFGHQGKVPSPDRSRAVPPPAGTLRAPAFAQASLLALVLAAWGAAPTACALEPEPKGDARGVGGDAGTGSGGSGSTGADGSASHGVGANPREHRRGRTL